MKSPSARLIPGVLVTLLIIGAYAGYTLNTVRRMRHMQSEIIDRNRKAGLQLIRIQGDLNSLAIAMRDMLDPAGAYPITAWSAQLDRMRDNLDDALGTESRLADSRRDPQQTKYLMSSFAQFWIVVDKMKALARNGDGQRARDIVLNSLQPQQEALTALTARLLVHNNEEEQRAALQTETIFAEMERNAYIFLALSLFLVVAVSVAIIRANRVLFDRLNELSNQRKELARQLISTQESTLRSISRDLHDEFGQILTALGAMLRRAARLAPNTEFQEQVRETNVVVQETLEKIRALSQSLQPVILEEQGLAAAVQWHLSVFERQTGIAVHYSPPEGLAPIDAAMSIHIFRILQEALNNVARHAKVSEVAVQLKTTPTGLMLEVEDRGGGIPVAFKPGVGLSGMRERAELLGGALTFGKANSTGTLVRLDVPIATGILQHG